MSRSARIVHRIAPVLVFAVLGAIVAGTATAAVFTVKLVNGTEIETRYRPYQAVTDENKILLLTEHGNWITLAKDYVVSIDSDFEARGFGTVLDATTIFLGYSPNDAPLPGDSEQSATDRMLEYLQQRDQPQDPFTVEQFAEPNSQGGIPLSFGSRSTPPLSSQGGEPPIAGGGG